MSSFDIIRKLFADPAGERLVFGNIQIPIPENEYEIQHGLLIEIGDIIIPYLYGDDFSVVNGTTVEGPYEIPERIELRQNDIVIDAGANLGLFSAVACQKGCEVYAFEPIFPIIDKYLSKTANWNSLGGGGYI
jgi:hypothetical protein